MEFPRIFFFVQPIHLKHSIYFTRTYFQYYFLTKAVEYLPCFCLVLASWMPLNSWIFSNSVSSLNDVPQYQKNKSSLNAEMWRILRGFSFANQLETSVFWATINNNFLSLSFEMYILLWWDIFSVLDMHHHPSVCAETWMLLCILEKNTTQSCVNSSWDFWSILFSLDFSLSAGFMIFGWNNESCQRDV